MELSRNKQTKIAHAGCGQRVGLVQDLPRNPTAAEASRPCPRERIGTERVPTISNLRGNGTRDQESLVEKTRIIGQVLDEHEDEEGEWEKRPAVSTELTPALVLPLTVDFQRKVSCLHDAA